MADPRPMTEADTEAVVSLWYEAYRAMALRHGLGVPARTPAWEGRLSRRVRYFLGTDPQGSWVAEADGSMVGLAQSVVRDGYWVLSLLATDPGHQGAGLGRALMCRALETASQAGRGTIQSSRDPAALALYASSGFALHPAVVGDGPVRRPVRPDPTVRRGDDRDLELVESVDLVVRGSARTRDVAAMLGEPGHRLLVVDGTGYAVAADDRVVTLAAREPRAAAALLRTALAEVPHGGNVEVSWLTALQQWAIATLVEAGVELHPYGAVMVRGMDGPPTPYIPSGGYG